MTKKKRLLIVSLGSIGRRHLRNARTLLPDAEIAVLRQQGVADRETPEGADHLFVALEAAERFKPEVVIIASPASSHIDNALTFLGAGAHLFIEKPLAVSCEGVERLLARARESDAFVMVGYVLRFLPALRAMRSMIVDGSLGSIRTAHIQVGQYLPDWRPDADYRAGVSAQKALGGGALLELSHEIDYATWLFGFPDAVQCSHARLSDLEMDVEDHAALILDYGRHQRTRSVMIQLDFLQRVAQMTVQVVGSRATLKADLIKEEIMVLDSRNPSGAQVNFARSADGNEPYLRQFDFLFARCFKDYKPRFPDSAGYDQWVDLEQGARVLRLVDTARQAGNEGRRLPFTALDGTPL